MTSHLQLESVTGSEQNVLVKRSSGKDVKGCLSRTRCGLVPTTHFPLAHQVLPERREQFWQFMEKMFDLHGGSKAAESAIETVAPKVEQARVAAEEEHQLSVWSALTTNKTVVFWCIFFAFSAVGWYACPLQQSKPVP